MTHREPENAKAIAIQYYDFRVDYKVEENEVMENFLDPDQNRHIQVLGRPQSAKQISTFGSPQKQPSRKNLNPNQIEGHTPDLKGLVVFGTNNPSKGTTNKKIEDYEPVVEEENTPPPPMFEEEEIDAGTECLAPKNMLIKPTSTAEPPKKKRDPPEPSDKKWVPPAFAPKDIKTWVNSSPPKSLSKNPMLALSMFRKKTKNQKSETVVKHSRADYENSEMNNIVGGQKQQNITDSINIDTSHMQGGSISNRPGSAAAALTGQKKGFSAGKKITKDQQKFLKETKEQNAGKSSGVSVTFDKRKEQPKKANQAGFGSSANLKTSTSAKTRPQSAHVAQAISLMKKLANTKMLLKQPSDIKDEDLLDDDGEPYFTSSSLLKSVGMMSKTGKSSGMNAGTFKRVQDIVSMGMSKQQQRPASATATSTQTNLQQKGQANKFLVTNPAQVKRQKEEIKKARFDNINEAAIDQEFADDNFEDAGQGFDDYNYKNTNDGGNLFEEEAVEGGDEAAPPIQRPFKSNMSSALEGVLSDDVLFSNKNDETNLSESIKKPERKASQAESGPLSVQGVGAKNQVSREHQNNIKNMRDDHNLLFSKVQNGVDVNRLNRGADGEKAYKNRKQITENITTYLKEADEKRKKKIDDYFGVQGAKAQKYAEDSDPQMIKAKQTNQTLHESVGKMKDLINGVKNFDKTHTSWVQNKTEQLGQKQFNFVSGLEERLARRKKLMGDGVADSQEFGQSGEDFGGKYRDEFSTNQISKPEIDFNNFTPEKGNHKSPSNTSLLNVMSNYKGFNEWEQGVDVDNDDEFEEVN